MDLGHPVVAVTVAEVRHPVGDGERDLDPGAGQVRRVVDVAERAGERPGQAAQRRHDGDRVPVGHDQPCVRVLAEHLVEKRRVVRSLERPPARRGRLQELEHEVVVLVRGPRIGVEHPPRVRGDVGPRPTTASFGRPARARRHTRWAHRVPRSEWHETPGSARPSPPPRPAPRRSAGPCRTSRHPAAAPNRSPPSASTTGSRDRDERARGPASCRSAATRAR